MTASDYAAASAYIRIAALCQTQMLVEVTPWVIKLTWGQDIE